MKEANTNQEVNDLPSCYNEWTYNVEQKCSETNLKASSKHLKTPLDIDSWKELEEKIVRVLTYRHYDNVKLLYLNKDYKDPSFSSRSLKNELELQSAPPSDGSNILGRTIVVEYSVVPEEQETERVVIRRRSRWKRFKRSFRTFLALAACWTFNSNVYL